METPDELSPTSPAAAAAAATAIVGELRAVLVQTAQGSPDPQVRAAARRSLTHVGDAQKRQHSFFDQFDQSNDGVINMEELTAALGRAGGSVPQPLQKGHPRRTRKERKQDEAEAAAVATKEAAATSGDWKIKRTIPQTDGTAADGDTIEEQEAAAAAAAAPAQEEEAMEEEEEEAQKEGVRGYGRGPRAGGRFVRRGRRAVAGAVRRRRC